MTQSINQNWVTNETLEFLRNRDKKRLAKLKSNRSDKRFKLVKVCDCPATYIEVEIT